MTIIIITGYTFGAGYIFGAHCIVLWIQMCFFFFPDPDLNLALALISDPISGSDCLW